MRLPDSQTPFHPSVKAVNVDFELADDKISIPVPGLTVRDAYQKDRSTVNRRGKPLEVERSQNSL
jgi:hypothetical protein